MIPFNNFCYNSYTVTNAVFRCDFLLSVRFVFRVLFAICLFALCSRAASVIRLMAVSQPINYTQFKYWCCELLW